MTKNLVLLTETLTFFCFGFHFTERNSSKFGWFLTFVVLAAIATAGTAGYVFYKYRLRVTSHKYSSIKLYSFVPFLFVHTYTQNLDFFLIIACSLTWTRRLWRLWHSTCHSTASIIIKSFNTKVNLYVKAHHLCKKGMYVTPMFSQNS